MAQSPESESRTAAIGRKRKQPPTAVWDDQLYRPPGDENARRDSNISKESGEISTSAESRRASNVDSNASQDQLDPTINFQLGDDETANKRRKLSPTIRGAPDTTQLMTLDDIEPPLLQKHVRKLAEREPERPVVDLVRGLLPQGQAFCKQAKLFLESRGLVTRASPQPASEQPKVNMGTKEWDPSTMTVPELEAVFGQPQRFNRSLELSDMSGKDLKQLRKALQAATAENPNLTIVQATVQIIKDGESDKPVRGQRKRAKEARQVFKHYLNRCLEAPRKKRAIAGTGDTTARQMYDGAQDLGPNQFMDAEYGSDSDVSVGDQPRSLSVSNDYGELARQAASGHADTMSGPVRLNDITQEEQILQYRYFRLSDPNAFVRCLCCGEEGHMEDGCPQKTCKHCSSQQHFSGACPTNRKCARCRQRGHSSRGCHRRTVDGGGAGDPCDVCGGVGHVEEECSQLWCSYDMAHEPGEYAVRRISDSEMTRACYNCGGHSHFGDDCPTMPAWLKRKLGNNKTWSAEHARRFLSEDGRGDGGGNAEHGGYHANAYQLSSAFDDMRD